MLTCQENTSGQKTAPLDCPLVGFEPQMQSSTLQDKTEMESEYRDSTSSEIDTTHYITLIEKTISELEIKHKQKKQIVKQQKSVLVTKDMIYASS